MSLTPDLMLLFVIWFVVFIFSTTLHEAAHALAAQRLGDETAYLGGQVSLNPLPHIQREPVGMLLVPLLSFFLMGGQWMIGWASAPYDPTWAARHPRKSAWMAAAGPVANLVLVLVAGILIKIGLSIGWLAPPSQIAISSIVAGTDAAGSGGAALFLSVLFVLNLVLFLFNLLPLPPMDGSSVIQLFLPADAARAYQSFLRQPMWAMVGLVLAWRFFPVVFLPLFRFSLGLLYGTG